MPLSDSEVMLLPHCHATISPAAKSASYFIHIISLPNYSIVLFFTTLPFYQIAILTTLYNSAVMEVVWRVEDRFVSFTDNSRKLNYYVEGKNSVSADTDIVIFI